MVYQVGLGGFCMLLGFYQITNPSASIVTRLGTVSSLMLMQTVCMIRTFTGKLASSEGTLQAHSGSSWRSGRILLASSLLWR